MLVDLGLWSWMLLLILSVSSAIGGAIWLVFARTPAYRVMAWRFLGTGVLCFVAAFAVFVVHLP